MLEHADRHDAIRLQAQLAVVLQADVHIQPLAMPPRQFQLLRRNRHPGHLNPVMARSVSGQAAPAAADVQHMHAGCQAQFIADQPQLGFLSVLQRRSLFPIAAGILHMRVQHRQEQIVAQVVMAPTDPARPAWRLQIEQARGAGVQQLADAARQSLLQAGAQNPMEECVQLLAVPPAVHIALPRPKDPWASTRRKKSGWNTLMSWPCRPLTTMPAWASKSATARRPGLRDAAARLSRQDEFMRPPWLAPQWC